MTTLRGDNGYEWEFSELESTDTTEDEDRFRQGTSGEKMAEKEVVKITQARPYFLKGPPTVSGQWGALVWDPLILPGALVEVVTRNGKRWTDRVGFIFCRNPPDGYAICTLVGKQAKKEVSALPCFLHHLSGAPDQWGAFVLDPNVEEGAAIRIETRGGAIVHDTVGKVITRNPDEGYAVCTVTGDKK